MVDHHDPSSSLVATFLHYLVEIPMFFNVFMYALLSVCLLHLQNPQHNFINMMCFKALKSKSFAVRSVWRALIRDKEWILCKCSTYVTFSTSICVHALQTTLCVAPCARCRSGLPASWATLWQPGRQGAAPNSATSLTPPDSSRRGRRGAFQTCTTGFAAATFQPPKWYLP